MPMPSSTFSARDGPAAGGKSLPLGPTGYGNSPYQSTSSFAGNPLLVDVDNLIERGWLTPESCLHDPTAACRPRRFRCSRCLERGIVAPGIRGLQDQGAMTRISRNSSPPIVRWLDDYVLYQSLKDVHAGLAVVRMGTRARRARPDRAGDQWRERLDQGNSLPRVCAIRI